MLPSLLLSAVALLTAGLLSGPAAAFGFDDVAALARQESLAPYRAPEPISPALKALKYDAYRDIRYRTDRAAWRAEALPFELMFFHPGGPASAQPVKLHDVTPAGVREIRFDAKDYDYGPQVAAPATLGATGHAGFRVHTALNDPAYKDELVVFLGASYFRALGRGQQYGLSARGLAIDTGGAQPEEFPVFKAFWFERPAPGAQALTLYAQLDSPRATGAYQFTLRPGDATAVDVRMRLFLRDSQALGLPPITTLGIAPLTSMFLHGENAPRSREQAGDFRPEVHDSDGLMVAAGNGEWLWRPLINPKRTRTSTFSVTDPKGFGLMQRDRQFRNYEDTEARYERRPSAWIEPRGAWGEGRVELVELPTPDETHDNIVAYWVPARLPAPGQPLDLGYTLHWQGDRPTTPPSGWATQSRLGHGYVDTAKALKNDVFYVVDFDGPALKALAPDAAVQAVVTADANGQLLESNAYRHPVTGGWRMTLHVQRLDVTRPLELRAFLKSASNALTETWTTLIQAD
ncbi:MAG: glucan biosynthesis protein D [Methylibium sp. NZG]|nr:MAG: glucan biosynthesis protein D [Methylibium sp. NZG]